MYHVLDEKGNRIGVPIKASCFYNKPTLKFLEGKFTENSAAKQPFRASLKNSIDLTLFCQKNFPIADLIKELERKGIYMVLRQNSEGSIYGNNIKDIGIVNRSCRK